MKRFGFYIPALIFLGLLGYMAIGLTRDPGELPSALIGKPMPEFDLAPLEGFDEGLKSSDLKGQVFMLNVWGSWCEPCKEENPIFMAISDRNLVPIYGINWRDPQGQGTRWLRVWGNPFTANGYDFEGRTVIDLGVSAAPETFIIDRQGIIRYRHEGAVTPQIWEEEMYPLIQELQK